jgi:hypothetical protein
MIDCTHNILSVFIKDNKFLPSFAEKGSLFIYYYFVLFMKYFKILKSEILSNNTFNTLIGVPKILVGANQNLVTESKLWDYAILKILVQTSWNLQAPE